ncbi:helix-turn-helix domain-containing protein [Microbacterium sp. RD1]|uniref:helix-turn-helix domain-containing protein n=1 Tax=Microbacterium sp. RD1 TaxID=3457313 RepID=UPI003FA5669E
MELRGTVDRPQPSMPLGALLTDLGSTVLDIAYGKIARELEVRDVVLLDPLDPPSSLDGALVLGAGVSGVGATVALLEALAEGGAAGLVLRDPVSVDPEVADAAAAAGMPVFALSRGVGWVQVANSLVTTLAGDPVDATGEERPAVTSGRFDADYLFEMANATSQLLDAPIMIEDLNSHILAYSDDQDRADDARRIAVLGSRMPAHYVELFRASGAFKSIYASDTPVYLDDLGEGVLPRAVVRLSAGNEILGSLWAAVRGPLAPAQEASFVAAARIVASHLLRGRADMDAERRARRAVLAALLAGGATAASMADGAGIATGSYVVLAVEIAGAGNAEEAREDIARETRIAHALSLHLSAVHPGSVAGLVHGRIYGVLHLRTEPASSSAYVRQVAEQFVERMTDDVIVTIGPLVRQAEEIGTSQREADRTLRLVLSSETGSERRVVRSEDVQTELLLWEMRERMAERGETFTGPVAALTEWDRVNDTDFAQTLDVFLSSFGDIARTASVLNVHPNTCRYRLRRISEMTGLDLSDPDARFEAMLQLRLLRL